MLCCCNLRAEQSRQQLMDAVKDRDKEKVVMALEICRRNKVETKIIKEGERFVEILEKERELIKLINEYDQSKKFKSLYNGIVEFL